MNAEIFAALAQLEKERGIPQAYMVDKITQALVAAYKKDKDGYTDNVFGYECETFFFVEFFEL